MEFRTRTSTAIQNEVLNWNSLNSLLSGLTPLFERLVFITRGLYGLYETFKYVAEDIQTGYYTTLLPKKVIIEFERRVNVEKRDKKIRAPENSKSLSVLTSFKFILPKRYREEFAGDIFEIYSELRNEGHRSTWIHIILFLNVASVFWAAIRFKSSEYFQENQTPVEKKKN